MGVFIQMKVWHVAIAFVVMFILYGVALAIVGIAIVGSHLLGGTAAIIAGTALTAAGVKLAVDTRRGRFQKWLLDVIRSAPL